MKKLISVITVITVILMLFAACGQVPTDTGETKETVSAAEGNTAEETGTSETYFARTKDTLVVVFSVTGHTKSVAETIARLTDADLYEIEAAQPYSSEDIDLNNSNCRATREQTVESVRPAIGSKDISLDGCKTFISAIQSGGDRRPVS
ncbi:MAG: hypothetical protein K5756_06865 [Clostridiales bacterium]|nr:hypothetical protein [Clostridiales bacterium]